MSVILDIKNLSVEFDTGQGIIRAVDSVNYQIQEGESVGLAGESGSGKTVSAMMMLGLLPANSAKVVSGEILYTNAEGKTFDLIKISEKERRKIRGNEIGMIFQEPASSLNPVLTCGEQIAETLRTHLGLSDSAAKTRTLELLQEVKLNDAARIASSFPHELSGGQKQRVMIAMAISCNPRMLIADEPTTALDVTVQKSILLLLEQLRRKYAMSLLFITHDLAVLAGLADRILIMRQGKVVEDNSIREVFLHPKNPYTQGLLSCRPTIDERPERLPTVEEFLKSAHTEKLGDFVKPSLFISAESRRIAHEKLFSQEPLLKIKDVHVTFQSNSGLFSNNKQEIKAVDGVSFDIFPGETLGLVGESGCGKTTLGRAILRLIEAKSGEVIFRGKNLFNLQASDLRKERKQLQMVFQDPYSSLNPRMRIGDAIMEPMLVHGLQPDVFARRKKALELLNKVGLTRDHFNRFPNEFSGGQRQRICIARALASEPGFIVFDESVSSLDVSAQAVILNLINELKSELGFTCLFISHDLSVVKYMSDRIVVMNQGKIEELAEADALYKNPKSTYTQSLIASIPLGRPQDIDRAIELRKI